ncbi:MAG: hypothetical protein ACYCWW_18310 [Deltaproteobacteria bacterium]
MATLRGLGLLALLLSPGALAAPLAILPLPDAGGRGSGREETRAVAEGLALQGLEIFPGSEAARAARNAGFAWGPTLTDERGAQLAQSLGWAGILRFHREGRHALRPELLLADGSLQSLPRFPAARHPGRAALAALARELRPLIGRRPVTAARAPAPEAAPEPTERAPVASDEPSPTAPAEPSAPAGASPSPRRSLYRLAAGGFAGTRTLIVPGVFSYVTAVPYGGPELSGELFPFSGSGPLLAGLGVMGDFSYGFVQAAFQGTAGGSGSFTANDLDLELALDYRLPAFIEGSHAPTFSVLLGFGLRNFDAPPSSGLFDDDRTFPLLGGGVELPLVVRWLDVSGRLLWLPLASQGAAAQDNLGTSQGNGFEWTLGLGGALWGGFGWLLQLDGQDFTDAHAQFTGSESYTQYRLLLSFAG